MNLALNLLGLLLTAALVENPFYTRCFMAETVDAQLNERRDVMLRSIVAAAMCLPRRRRYISAPNAAAPWSMREAVSSAATAVSPNADKDASA